MKKIFLLFLSTFLLFFTFGVYQSSASMILLPDFTLKVPLTGGDKYIDNIDYLLYTGISHVDITGAGPLLPVSGDTFSDVVAFSIDSLGAKNDSTGSILLYRDGSTISATDFEVTGLATLSGVHDILTSGVNAHYTFTTATLDLYLDITPDASPGEGAGTISGYKDGISLGTFTLLSGGGNFDFTYMDGNIDVDFITALLTSGYLFASDGTDFADIGSFIAALTDSNTKALKGSGAPIVLPTNWLAYTGQVVGTDPFDLSVQVDGSDRFASVPEPGTLALLGIGLIGFAALGRKKLFKRG